MKIIFLGTPEFSVPILQALYASEHQVIAVVTATDKYIGRGKNQLSESAVKKAALELGIPVLQPKNLKSQVFVDELKAYGADLQVVVAFRMLPVIVWDMPTLGTMNVHASLLPRYRGAAPINWAIINGEKFTGLSSFLLKHEIDTGDLIKQIEIPIGEDMSAGDLHDEMMKHSAKLVLDSIKFIQSTTHQLQTQDNSLVSKAPKIHSPDCEIDWKQNAQNVHNHIRGLSPFPTAWSMLGKKRLKIYATSLCSIEFEENNIDGYFQSEKKLYHTTNDGIIEILRIQLEGKKRMTAEEFLRGSGQNLPKSFPKLS